MKYLSILFLAILLSACGGEQQATATAEAAPTVTPNQPTPALKVAPKPTSTANMPQAKAGQNIEWLSITEVQERVKKEPRKILVDVYTAWCGPCKMMMRSTFKDPGLIKYLDDNYYAVKFNGESGETISFNGKEFKNPNYNAAIPSTRRNSQHEFTRSLGLRGYPTLFIFDPNLKKITESVGMKSAPQLMNVLKKLES
ncbi:MAG: thioredoxin-related protein [Polaribacter sp.]|jgi:thioredoxin-related protein